MAVYVQPQREPGEGDAIRDLQPKYAHQLRSWVFIHYDFVVTAPYAGYFEWWFPYVDFGGRDAKIWHATLEKSANIGNPQVCRLMLQSPSETVRTMIHEFDFRAGIERAMCPNFVVPNKARGVGVFDAILEGTELRADYLIEVF